MVVAGLLLVARAALTLRDAGTSDFRCLYEGARLVATGGDPYDRTAWAAATLADPANPPPCNETFIYPLWTALALAPLTTMSEPAALVVWEALTLAALVAAVALLARAWRAPGLAGSLLPITLWSQPAFSVVANAQLGGVLLLGLAGLSLGLATSRTAAAVASWLVLLLKPNVTFAPLVGALVTRRPVARRPDRAFATLAVLAAAAAALVTIALVPAWPLELWRELAPQGRLADPGVDTLWGLAAALGLPAALALLVSIAGVLGLALLLPRRRPGALALLAVLVPVSLVLTPYARVHDHVTLVVTWGAVLAVARRAGGARVPLTVATVAVGLVLPWLLTALSLVGLPIATRVLVPYASGLLLAYALRRDSVG